MNQFVLMALAATLGTWFVTALGAATVAFFKSPNQKALNLMLGFASGVMIAASFWSLLQPAIERAEVSSSLPAYVVATVGFCSAPCSCGDRTKSCPLPGEMPTAPGENVRSG